MINNFNYLGVFLHIIERSNFFFSSAVGKTG